MGQVLARKELTLWTEKWRKQNLRIVLTNGCFDILHVGHVRSLKEAKSFGDILVVGLNSDKSVRNLKGETRPIISEIDRAELIAALNPVDFVTVFNEKTATELIKIIKPRFYVKGGDYTIDNLPERDILLQYQVEVKFIPLVFGVSTTELVNKIKKANI